MRVIRNAFKNYFSVVNKIANYRKIDPEVQRKKDEWHAKYVSRDTTDEERVALREEYDKRYKETRSSFGKKYDILNNNIDKFFRGKVFGFILGIFVIPYMIVVYAFLFIGIPASLIYSLWLIAKRIFNLIF
tara:strand:- start:580 stop:972 length:393 start_codon:yes stop_codon:yes gene_type:complete